MAKLNGGSSSWDLTKYYINKNWNLEDWNEKTENYEIEMIKVKNYRISFGFLPKN